VTIGFRALTAEDLPLVHEWLMREHVKRWWEPDESYEKTVAEYLPAIEGREPTDMFLILLDGRPVGMIQTYLVVDYPEWEEILHVGPGVAGVDLFIGEAELTGGGLGVEIVRAFTRDVVFAHPGTHACVAGVNVENHRSLRAFEKAGFVPGEEYTEKDGKLERLMRLERVPRSGPDPDIREP
jgi:RimJ/RimL family protein N-acetyltransferase